MKKVKKIFSDIVVVIARPIINILLRREISVHTSGETISKNREPFLS